MTLSQLILIIGQHFCSVKVRCERFRVNVIESQFIGYKATYVGVVFTEFVLE